MNVNMIKSRNHSVPFPMSYCHVAPVRYEAVALRVGVHLAYRRAERGESPKKGERKGSTGVPFEHRFGCDVAGMEVTMFSVLAPPARRCLLQLVVVVSGVRVPVGEGSDGGIAHAWSWSC